MSVHALLLLFCGAAIAAAPAPKDRFDAAVEAKRGQIVERFIRADLGEAEDLSRLDEALRDLGENGAPFAGRVKEVGELSAKIGALRPALASAPSEEEALSGVRALCEELGLEPARRTEVLETYRSVWKKLRARGFRLDPATGRFTGENGPLDRESWLRQVVAGAPSGSGMTAEGAGGKGRAGSDAARAASGGESGLPALYDGSAPGKTLAKGPQAPGLAAADGLPRGAARPGAPAARPAAGISTGRTGEGGRAAEDASEASQAISDLASGSRIRGAVGAALKAAPFVGRYGEAVSARARRDQLSAEAAWSARAWLGREAPSLGAAGAAAASRLEAALAAEPTERRARLGPALAEVQRLRSSTGAGRMVDKLLSEFSKAGRDASRMRELSDVLALARDAAPELLSAVEGFGRLVEHNRGSLSSFEDGEVFSPEELALPPTQDGLVRKATRLGRAGALFTTPEGAQRFMTLDGRLILDEAQGLPEKRFIGVESVRDGLRQVLMDDSGRVLAEATYRSLGGGHFTETLGSEDGIRRIGRFEGNRFILLAELGEDGSGRAAIPLDTAEWKDGKLVLSSPKVPYLWEERGAGGKILGYRLDPEVLGGIEDPLARESVLADCARWLAAKSFGAAGTEALLDAPARQRADSLAAYLKTFFSREALAKGRTSISFLPGRVLRIDQDTPRGIYQSIGYFEKAWSVEAASGAGEAGGRRGRSEEGFAVRVRLAPNAEAAEDEKKPPFLRSEQYIGKDTVERVAERVESNVGRRVASSPADFLGQKMAAWLTGDDSRVPRSPWEDFQTDTVEEVRRFERTGTQTFQERVAARQVLKSEVSPAELSTAFQITDAAAGTAVSLVAAGAYRSLADDPWLMPVLAASSWAMGKDFKESREHARILSSACVLATPLGIKLMDHYFEGGSKAVLAKLGIHEKFAFERAPELIGEDIHPVAGAIAAGAIDYSKSIVKAPFMLKALGAVASMGTAGKVVAGAAGVGLAAMGQMDRVQAWHELVKTSAVYYKIEGMKGDPRYEAAHRLAEEQLLAAIRTATAEGLDIFADKEFFIRGKKDLQAAAAAGAEAGGDSPRSLASFDETPENPGAFRRLWRSMRAKLGMDSDVVHPGWEDANRLRLAQTMVGGWVTDETFLSKMKPALETYFGGMSAEEFSSKITAALESTRVRLVSSNEDGIESRTIAQYRFRDSEILFNAARVRELRSVQVAAALTHELAHAVGKGEFGAHATQGKIYEAICEALAAAELDLDFRPKHVAEAERAARPPHPIGPLRREELSPWERRDADLRDIERLSSDPPALGQALIDIGYRMDYLRHISDDQPHLLKFIQRQAQESVIRDNARLKMLEHIHAVVAERMNSNIPIKDEGAFFVSRLAPQELDELRGRIQNEGGSLKQVRLELGEDLSSLQARISENLALVHEPVLPAPKPRGLFQRILGLASRDAPVDDDSRFLPKEDDRDLEISGRLLAEEEPGKAPPGPSVASVADPPGKVPAEGPGKSPDTAPGGPPATAPDTPPVGPASPSAALAAKPFRRTAVTYGRLAFMRHYLRNSLDSDLAEPLRAFREKYLGGISAAEFQARVNKTLDEVPILVLRPDHPKVEGAYGVRILKRNGRQWILLNGGYVEDPDVRSMQILTVILHEAIHAMRAPDGKPFGEHAAFTAHSGMYRAICDAFKKAGVELDFHAMPNPDPDPELRTLTLRGASQDFHAETEQTRAAIRADTLTERLIYAYGYEEAMLAQEPDGVVPVADLHVRRAVATYLRNEGYFKTMRALWNSFPNQEVTITKDFMESWLTNFSDPAERTCYRQALDAAKQPDGTYLVVGAVQGLSAMNQIHLQVVGVMLDEFERITGKKYLPQTGNP